MGIRVVQSPLHVGRLALLPTQHAALPPLTSESVGNLGAVSWISWMMSLISWISIWLTYLYYLCQLDRNLGEEMGIWCPPGM